MSLVLETETKRPSLLERLNIAQTICALVVAVGGVGVSVWVTQSVTTWRVGAVEKRVDDNKAEREKQLDDIRNKMITRTDFDALLRDLSEIREDVKEIRAEQLRQARESK